MKAKQEVPSLLDSLRQSRLLQGWACRRTSIVGAIPNLPNPSPSFMGLTACRTRLPEGADVTSSNRAVLIKIVAPQLPLPYGFHL